VRPLPAAIPTNAATAPHSGPAGPILSSAAAFLEGFEAVHALRRDDVRLRALVPDYRGGRASRHKRTRAVVVAMSVLATRLTKSG
jgi:hypothetical protein